MSRNRFSTRQKVILHGWGWILAGSLIFAHYAPAVATEEALPDAQLEIIESNDQAIVVQLTVNRYAVETLGDNGDSLTRIRIDGLEQTANPGLPEAPSRGLLLAIPSTTDVTVQVLDAEQVTLTGHRPSLSPLPPDVHQDGSPADGDHPVLYSSNAMQAVVDDALSSPNESARFYPAEPVEIGDVGYLRDQGFVQLQFYPVQFDAKQQAVRIYRRLVVKVTWLNTVETANHRVWQESPVYESLMRTSLLNYDSLIRRAPVSDARAAAAPAPVTTNAETTTPMLKINIDSDGLYRLAREDLIKAGYTLNAVDPRTFKITNQDRELSILVRGEEDGVFDQDDDILFFGTGLRNRYTSSNVYWLSAGGDLGRRMTQQKEHRLNQPRSTDAQFMSYLPIIAANVGPPLVVHSFPTMLRAEEDTVYWQNMPGINEDRWFWGGRLSPNTAGIPASRSYPVVLRNIAVDKVATIRVALKGYTNLTHHTRISVNGNMLDEQYWRGQRRLVHQFAIDQSELNDGQNIVTVETVETGAIVDQILVDWIEVDYWDTLVAEDNELSFGAPGAGRYEFNVRGFDTADVKVFDVTDELAPVYLSGASITRNGTEFTVSFVADTRAKSRYRAVAATRFKSSGRLVLDEPSNLKSTANSADYIIITHPDFYASALRLAEFRRASGLRVMTVKIDDLYDEFNGGIFSPEAIRRFLDYAYHHWQPSPPTYVLLLGDANQDYKDNLKTGTKNYVPSMNIESSLFGEVSSDNYFVTVSGADALPDMLIGRLVGQDSQQAAEMVDKIIRYEQLPPDSSWQAKMLFVSDDDEPRFEEISNDLAGRLPYYYDVMHISAAETSQRNVTEAIVARIESGSIIVNYTGHGEYYAWGIADGQQSALFDVDDAEQLNNSDKLPVVVVANCLNGFFAGPQGKPALAEALQRNNKGGAVAVWAPTSLGLPSGHRILLGEFYDAIFVRDHTQLGAATTAAKISTVSQSYFWEEMIATYVLFGDPATTIGIPTNFPYVISVSPTPDATEVPIDQNVLVTFNKSVDPESLNLFSANAPGMSFTPSSDMDRRRFGFTHDGFLHRSNLELMVRAKDDQGNELGAGLISIPWSFRVTTDDIVPTARIDVQGNEQDTVIATSTIKVLFSEPVRQSDFEFLFLPAANGTLVWSSDRTSVEYRHERLQIGTTYTLLVTQIKDSAGNLMLQPVYTSFIVRETYYSHLPLVTSPTR